MALSGAEEYKKIKGDKAIGLPSISLITATRNARASLERSLESVARQTVSVEHILIDGNSIDGTKEMLASYTGHPIRFVSEPDSGLYDALNKGIASASGDVIGILNADDFYAHEQVIENIQNIFADAAVDACYADLCYVSDTSKYNIVRYWQSGSYDVKKFYRGWMPPHPTFFVRRKYYTKYGGFLPDLGSAADYELMLRFLVKYQLRVAYLPQVVVYMQTGGISNKHLINRIQANRQDACAWKLNGLTPLPWTLLLKPLRKVAQWFRRP